MKKKKFSLKKFIQIFQIFYQNYQQKIILKNLFIFHPLGIEKSVDSNYALSKLEGENKIKKKF